VRPEEDEADHRREDDDDGRTPCWKLRTLLALLAASMAHHTTTVNFASWEAAA